MNWHKPKLAATTLLLMAILAFFIWLWSCSSRDKFEATHDEVKSKAVVAQGQSQMTNDELGGLVSEKIVKGTNTADRTLNHEAAALVARKESNLNECVSLADFGLSDQYKSLTDWQSNFTEVDFDISLDGKLVSRKSPYHDYSIAKLRSLIENGVVEPTATKTLAKKLIGEVYAEALGSREQSSRGQKNEDTEKYSQLTQESIDKLSESRRFFYEAAVQGDISALLELSNTYEVEYIFLSHSSSVSMPSDRINLAQSNTVKYRDLWSSLLNVKSSDTYAELFSEEERQALKEETSEAYALARSVKGYSPFITPEPPPNLEKLLPNICTPKPSAQNVQP